MTRRAIRLTSRPDGHIKPIKLFPEANLTASFTEQPLFTPDNGTSKTPNAPWAVSLEKNTGSDQVRSQLRRKFADYLQLGCFQFKAVQTFMSDEEKTIDLVRSRLLCFNALAWSKTVLRIVSTK
jgi:hypothetical protein